VGGYQKEKKVLGGAGRGVLLEGKEGKEGKGTGRSGERGVTRRKRGYWSRGRELERGEGCY
jgi:hypothetical protein